MNRKYLVRAFVRRLGYDLVKFHSTSSLSSHLTLLFKKLRTNCVIDVGGHYGEYGRMLRDNGYTGRIVSFEPISSNFEIISAASKADPLWHAENMALGEQEGQLQINVTKGSGLDSFLQPSKYGLDALGRAMEVDRVETVSVATMDSVFDKCIGGISVPSVYLKLDTQGWDINVLNGAKTSMDRIAALQSEISIKHLYEGMADFSQSVRSIEALGYEMSGMFPVLLDAEYRAIELDVIMIRNRAGV